MAEAASTKSTKEKSAGGFERRPREVSQEPAISGTQAQVLSLQRKIGNRAVSNLLLTATHSSGTGAVLQRRCSTCATSGTKCDECDKKRTPLLQRNTCKSGGEPQAVPRIVDTVLSSAGQPLDSSTRALLEPRFGHEFSRVRIHTDSRAGVSAAAINADAYTVGNNVVFGTGKYDVSNPGGLRLLSHELSHVVQQGETVQRSTKSTISNDQSSEREADAIAERVVNGLPAPARNVSGSGLMRKIKVDKPGDPIPNPTGTGQIQTNAETAEGYLRTLSPDGGVTVNRSSGEVSVKTGYCPGFVGGFLQGGRAGYRIGHMIGSVGGHVPLLGQLFGAVGAVVGSLIGGIVGGIGSLFGAKSPSAAAASATPAGSICICDLINSKTTLSIQINDQERPAGAETVVRVPSPNSQKIWGTATVGGSLRDIEPWLILGHEMCGHSLLSQRGGDEEGSEKDRTPYVGRNPQTGLPEIQEGEPGNRRQPGAGQYLRHGRTVDIENRIRAEHGIEARGYRLRDPYCGESYWRDRSTPNAPVNWQKDEGAGLTYLEECEFLRSQLPESQTRTYRIDERIPEQPPSSGGRIQRKASRNDAMANGASAESNAEHAASAPPIVEQVVASGGQALDSITRALFEPQFNADFSDVRVHTGTQAGESARAVAAQAYTLGNDIVFEPGAYAPKTTAGSSLLAHELTHVLQQRGTAASNGPGRLIQRAPKTEKTGTGNLQLPWSNGIHSLFEVSSHGIRVVVGVLVPEEPAIRKIIPSVAERIAKSNKLIKDPSLQVLTCFIAATTTRFALWYGQPVLMLSPEQANPQTTAHEMGHAVNYALGLRSTSSAANAGDAGNFRLRIAAIFHQLGTTKKVTLRAKSDEGGEKEEEHRAGHWMVDRSQWLSGGTLEHPWHNPDEFFASATSAHQTDRAALRKSIDRFVKIDPAVAAPAKELLTLLDDFLGAGKLPTAKVSGAQKKTAEAALARDEDVSKVEDTARNRSVETALELILDPNTRTAPEKAEPEDSVSTPGKRKQPNMVTGPGGVIESMDKRMRERMREKILESEGQP